MASQTLAQQNREEISLTAISIGHSAEKSASSSALLATAVTLGAALAHALELANKLGLSQNAYFTVQGFMRAD